MKFSVLMSVYKNDNPEHFRQAVDSVINQTEKPEEVVLVRDGIVPQDLQNVIDEYVNSAPALFTYISYEENKGLGLAMQLGLESCRNDVVARMDSDDIADPTRFEKQVKFLQENPNVDVCGGNITEFIDDKYDIVDKRIVPSTDEKIKTLLKTRSPMNHMTTMYKKQAVLDAGNYQDFYLVEDWYLWARMALNGCVFANLEEILVNVRINGMIKRRSGYKYYKSIKKMLKFLKDSGLTSSFGYFKAKTIRFIGYVLCPNWLRSWCYKVFLRKK